MSISDLQAIIPVLYIHISIKNVSPPSPSPSPSPNLRPAPCINSESSESGLHPAPKNLLFLSPFTGPPRAAPRFTRTRHTHPRRTAILGSQEARVRERVAHSVLPERKSCWIGARGFVQTTRDPALSCLVRVRVLGVGVRFQAHRERSEPRPGGTEHPAWSTFGFWSQFPRY